MNIVVFVNPLQEIHEFWEDVITNMSESDKAAIEFALQLKEKKNGKVTAVAIGGEDADKALREAFAMGVDEAAILKDPAPEENEAGKIAAVLKQFNADVFVSGRNDDVMKKASEQLGVPQVDSKEFENNSSKSLVMVKEGDFDPRFMTIPGVYTAYKRVVQELSI